MIFNPPLKVNEFDWQKKMIKYFGSNYFINQKIIIINSSTYTKTTTSKFYCIFFLENKIKLFPIIHTEMMTNLI